MPVRDWDKLRRYARAHNNYDPVASFKPRKARHNRRFKRLSLHKPLSSKDPVSTLKSPIARKVLQVFSPNAIVYSVWIRRSGKWHCVSAQEPLEWFTRLNNPSGAQHFLSLKHWQYIWLNAMPGADSIPMAPVEVPADSYTAYAPSHSSEVNTCPTLNNATQVVSTPRVTQVVKFPAASSPCTGAEWLHHSSPLNAPASAGSLDSKVHAVS